MAKLAIAGGNPVRSEPFPSWPVHGEEEKQALARVADSGKWIQGKEVKEFEQAFAAYQDAKHGICVTNGTTTMAIGLKALGVGPGDEVILPALSAFVTLATLICKAIPVYVDVEPDNLALDPKLIESAITERSKAIILIHLAGIPADMDAIMDLARKHNLGVIEDSAHAHGSEWKGTRIGAIGDLGSFSFQADKVMTSGDGGLILTNDDQLAETCRSYRNFGAGKDMSGGNYRMTEFQAAVLKVQLSRLDGQIEQRNDNLRHLESQLSGMEGISVPQIDPRVTRRSGYARILRYDAEKFGNVELPKFLEAVRAEGIPLNQVYVPAHHHSLFSKENFGTKGCPFTCHYYGKQVNYSEQHFPVAERAHYQEAIWVPRSALIGGREEMDDIVQAIAKVQENITELRNVEA